MASSEFDLLIHAGRVVCPHNGWNSPGSVAVVGDRISDAGPNVTGTARQTFDFPDGVLLPGLIDLHAHPAVSGSVFGVAPDEHLLPFGTTTVLSQGDAGAGNIDEFIQGTITQSRTRVKLAINLSSVGESTEQGCFENREWIDANACIAAIENHREHIWGIAVNTSHHACGETDPRDVLPLGLMAAEETGLPLLYGMRRPEDWPLEDQLAQLRPGDVVTYCFRREPHCIAKDGRVLPEVLEARKCGVRFDVGHGTASFDFEVAETAIRDGFLPNTISTDLQRRHIGSDPRHTLPLVMSKLQAAGMPEAVVFAAVTSRPADVLGLQKEIGTLTPGACADLVVLQRSETDVPLVDASGKECRGHCWMPVLTVRGGRVVVPLLDGRRPWSSNSMP